MNKIGFGRSFVSDCLSGAAVIEDINDYVEYWHQNDTKKSLRDFLGLTQYEYEEWLKNNDTILRDILKCRVDGTPFEDFKPQVQTENPKEVAAGETERKMVALRNLKVAMAAMGTAYKGLEEAMSSLYLGDVNTYVAEGYPFERSFDEMGDILDWTTCSIAKIDKELM